MNVRHLPIALLALCLATAGCRKDEITTYRVPKREPLLARLDRFFGT